MSGEGMSDRNSDSASGLASRPEGFAKALTHHTH